MTDDTSFKFDILTLSEAELVDQACDRFETAWRGGDWPCIEGYLDAVADRCRVTLLHELIKLELELRVKVGEQPTVDEYRLRFPDQAQAIDAIFAELHEASQDRSTFPDEVLGSAAPDPDAMTIDALTLDLDPRKLAELPRIDGALGRLLGEYVILDRLGSGGMGVVYRSFHRVTNRLVALKLIKAEWCGDSTEASSREAERRFRTEAQVLAALDHDHIVPLYDAGHTNGLLFFSMRLIHGRSLGQIVLSDGPLAPRRAAFYIEAIARAIQYAHDHQVVHRDVKPGNILVGENDRPYLIDLGLAKSLDATDYTTLTGKVLGTAEYMSPEQARGGDDIGFPADVYGLGATLFALLTGRPPFSGPTPLAVLRKVIDEDPAWPRECDKPVGPELKAICFKCLEKSPTNRFASAGELAVVLKKYLMYEPTGVSRPRPWVRLSKWVRRQPWRAAAVGLALLACLIAVAAWAWNAHKSTLTAELFLHDLRSMPMANLTGKIDQMAPFRGWINPRLHSLLSENPGDKELRTRIALALLPSEPRWAGELTDRLLTSLHDEHRVIRGALRGHRQSLLPALRRILDDTNADPGRRTRAAAALITVGVQDQSSQSIVDAAWSELRLAPDPDVRVALLEWIVRSKVDPVVLAARLDVEQDVSVRRMVIQALGGLGDGRPPEGLSAAFVNTLLVQYRQDGDAGVHSSLAYLLRRWGMDTQIKQIDQQLAGAPRGERRWYVNPAGLTLAVIEAPQSARAAPEPAGDLPARFVIATTEVPLTLFQQFDPTHAERRLKDSDPKPPTIPDAPADAISYFDAARFCNWLSGREGFPAADLCYRPGKSPGVMILEPGYLKRRGYRLPTIPEWIFAARAGTAGDRYFGRDLSFAGSYSWHQSNADGFPCPTARLRPNDFGLFDVIGNMTEWCHNPVTRYYPNCAVCPGPPGGSCELKLEAAKGGCYIFAPERQRVTDPFPRLGFNFDNLDPGLTGQFCGFRVARTEF